MRGLTWRGIVARVLLAAFIGAMLFNIGDNALSIIRTRREMARPCVPGTIRNVGAGYPIEICVANCTWDRMIIRNKD